MDKNDSLQQFVEKVTGESHLRVEQDLGDGFVRLCSAEAERRQAKHDIRKSEDIVIEMLRNSRDAGAGKIFVASWKEGEVRNLTVIDDGCGVPDSMVDRIFEARVTSKLDTMCMDLWGVHGRGMALYAIKTNADSARVVASKIGGGTAIHVEASTLRLGEKRDQSSFPVFTKDETGTVTVRGPKNINRVVLEFAYIERQDCQVFYGSPAEIASALYQQSFETVSRTTAVFCHDIAQMPVCDRLALASSPDDFADIARGLGLPMSSRTARRIMNREIEPALNAWQRISQADVKSPQSASDKGKGAVRTEEKGLEVDPFKAVDESNAVSLRLAESDRERFVSRVKESYSDLAHAYYLDPDVQVDIKLQKGRILVSIPLRRE